jgi:HD-GYP domain-containing protein (c-di-GMP phosphodiesterase class II)
LLKDGPLTPEERAIMEEHPIIGADILSSYSAFEKSVAFVRHHHERWDGKGYPDGIKGEQIPIGSRIISVVDAYDAMTSDRPYRRGMPPAQAVERLKAGMGSQFDPQVCATWIQILIEDGVYTPEEQAHHLRLVSPPQEQRTG